MFTLDQILQMTAAERAALPGYTKRQVVTALTGRRVSVVFAECYDPVAVAAEILATPQDAPLPVAEAGQRGGLR